MKKILILLAVLIAGGIGYYFGFGSAKVTEALKARVETELKVLQNNGFGVEDRKIEAKREHFIIHYADPDKIARYFRSKNINLSDEDAYSFKDLKIGVDLDYLKGAYSAVSADIYPVAFPPALIRVETRQGRSELDRIAKDKVFLVHIDLNKLFTSFQGRVKDIDERFKDVETTKIVSRGFKFGGTFSRDLLTSSSNTIEKLSITEDHEAGFTLEKLKGSYALDDKSIYNFSSNYTVGKIFLQDEHGQSITLKNLIFDTHGKAEKGFASSSASFKLSSADIHADHEEHRLEEISGKFSLENLSIAALEKMEQLDANDTEGFNQAFKSLLAQGIVLKMDEFSAKKIRDRDGKMADGFSINSIVKIDKVTDFKQIEENPFALLDIIDLSMHIELSDEIYIILQKQPEFAIVTLLFTPLSKDHKQLFDIEYKNGALKINGKPII